MSHHLQAGWMLDDEVIKGIKGEKTNIKKNTNNKLLINE